MNEIWTKRLLLVAAAWNVIGGASALLDPAQHFSQMYSSALSFDDPLQLYFYRCTWINVIAWGAAYLIAALRPATRFSVLAAGGAGKSVYFLACAALFASGGGSPLLLAAGIADLMFGVLFALALLSQQRREKAPASPFYRAA